MELEPMSAAWQRIGGDPADHEAVTRMVREGGLRLELHLSVRDRRETWIAWILVPVFVWLAVITPHRLSALGAGIVVLSCVLIPFVLRASRVEPLSASLPLVDAIRLELRRVEAQRRILRTVAWWYAGPLWLGVTLFIAGPLSPAAAGGAAVLTACFFGGLVAWNQVVVRRELDPRLAELRLALDAEDGVPSMRP